MIEIVWRSTGQEPQSTMEPGHLFVIIIFYLTAKAGQLCELRRSIMEFDGPNDSPGQPSITLLFFIFICFVICIIIGQYNVVSNKDYRLNPVLRLLCKIVK